MTTVPARTSPPRGRLLLLVLLAVLAAGGVVGYFVWAGRPQKVTVPAIPTEGRDPEVVAAVEKARAEVEEKPQSAEAWGRLGTVLFANDMYEECVPFLAEAERLAPNEPRWPYYRGLALILQRPEEGVAALRRAAAAAPDNRAVRLRLAEELLKLDRTDEADEFFREVLAGEPGNPRALLGRGLILTRADLWREALAPLKAAAEHPTARRAARVALAEAYTRLGDAAAAEAERKRAAESPADPGWPDPLLQEARAYRTGLQPRIDMALDLLNNGLAEQAYDLIEQVLRDHPDSAEAHLTLAKLMIRSGAFPDAERELRQAVGLNPKLVEGHYLLAGVLAQRKDYAAAERSYLRAIELKPAYGLAHYNLGDCRLKKGDRSGAAAAFRDAIRVRPDLALAHQELGALLLEDGKADEAVPLLETAVRLDGKSDRARKLLEEARAKKKD